MENVVLRSQCVQLVGILLVGYKRRMDTGMGNGRVSQKKSISDIIIVHRESHPKCLSLYKAPTTKQTRIYFHRSAEVILLYYPWMNSFST